MDTLVLVRAQLGHVEQWKAEDHFSVYSICCLLRLKKNFVKMRASLFEPQLQNGCHQAHYTGTVHFMCTLVK